MHTITCNPTEDSIMIRSAVFITEQGFDEEFDEQDRNSRHIVLYVKNQPAATARYFADQDGLHWIGRVAVMPDFRGRGLGKKVMELAEQAIAEGGGKVAALSSQQQAQAFYEKCGYVASGELYLDQHCPHIHMEKKLL